MPRKKNSETKLFISHQKLNGKHSIYSSDRISLKMACRQCGQKIIHDKTKYGYLCQICRRLKDTTKKYNNFSLHQTISSKADNTSTRASDVSPRKQTQPSKGWNRRVYSTDTLRNSKKQSHPYKFKDESIRIIRFKPEKNYVDFTSPANNLISNECLPNALVNPHVYSNTPAHSNDFSNDVFENEFSNKPAFSNQFSNIPAYSKEFPNVPTHSEEFPNVPAHSEEFSNLPFYSDKFSNTTLYSNKFSSAPVFFNESSNTPINVNEELIARNSGMLSSSQFENSCGSSLSNQTSYTSVYPKLKRKRKTKDLPLKRAKYTQSSSTSSLIHNVPHYEKLNKNIWDYFIKNHQTDDIFQTKMNLRSKLQSIVEQEFAGCGLFVFGSSMTGYASKTSDVDICLMFPDLKIARTKTLRILWNLRSLFSRHHFLSNFQVINAKVPIIMFKDRFSGFEIDLNVNNPTGIRNSQLLRSYARIDERVRPLILGTKWWARIHDINNAKNGTLSSYSLGLMVLHYLQYGCFPPVIPSLQVMQPNKYHPDSDIRTLKLDEDLPNFKSENNETVGQLFVGFLHYYSRGYDYDNSRISVRLGKLIPRVDRLENKEKKYIHWIDIEEPFELTNTARTVNTQKNASYIKSVFDNSYNTVNESGALGLI